MPERITFKKMLEMVEKETGLDNKESDKLLRRWFGIINEGLEKDGRVRISKLGTFKLKSVKERNGINPITRQAMVIPAHTKVVFKSAKHLKDTVNKKYNLLEAKSIKMNEKNSEKKVTKKDEVKKETIKKETDNEIDNIISQITEVPESEKKELIYEENISPVKEETKIDQIKRKQSEEVREKIEEKFAKKENDFTPTGVMPVPEEKPEEKVEPQKEAKEEKTIEEKEQAEKTTAPAPEKVKVVVQKEPEIKEPESPIIEPKNEEEKKSRLGLYIAAAIIILLLIVILFWKPWQQAAEVIAEKPVVKEVVKPDPQKPVVKKKVYKTPGGENAVTIGDNLWDLSDEYYKDAYLWPNIYRVNNESISNPDILLIGDVVTIPPLEGTFRNLTAKDSINISVGFFKAYEAYKRYGNQWAKYYLWVCKKYDIQTFKENKKDVEPQDAQFALSMK